jgi:hypothetical protein
MALAPEVWIPIIGSLGVNVAMFSFFAGRMSSAVKTLTDEVFALKAGKVGADVYELDVRRIDSNATRIEGHFQREVGRVEGQVSSVRHDLKSYQQRFIDRDNARKEP